MTELEFTSNNTFYYIFRYAKNEEISNIIYVKNIMK